MNDQSIPRRLFLKKAGAAGTAVAAGLAASQPLPMQAQTSAAFLEGDPFYVGADFRYLVQEDALSGDVAHFHTLDELWAFMLRVLTAQATTPEEPP